MRPGVPGVSENIHVRSIVGRFLEHTRVYYFENGGKAEVFAASADLMPRNLYRRVEIAFPIEHKPIRERVIEDLNNYLKDNTYAWILKEDRSYERMTPEKGSAKDNAPYSVQGDLLQKLAEG